MKNKVKAEDQALRWSIWTNLIFSDLRRTTVKEDCDKKDF